MKVIVLYIDVLVLVRTFVFHFSSPKVVIMELWFYDIVIMLDSSCACNLFKCYCALQVLEKVFVTCRVSLSWKATL